MLIMWPSLAKSSKVRGEVLLFSAFTDLIGHSDGLVRKVQRRLLLRCPNLLILLLQPEPHPPRARCREQAQSRAR